MQKRQQQTREGRRIKNVPKKRSVSINTPCKYKHVPMDSVTHVPRVHLSVQNVLLTSQDGVSLARITIIIKG